MSSAIQTDINEVESRFLQRVFFVFMGLAILSLLINLAGRYIGFEIAKGGHTDVLSSREIVIGNDVLNIPDNMIRTQEQRRDGIAKRIDLYAQWPHMTGYSEESKAVFNNLDQQGRLMFISFDRRSMVRDMSGRFEPIYQPMLDGKGESLPNGLTRYRLPEKAGFLDEYLYVGRQTDQSLFVARCLDNHTASSTMTPCDRDIHVGNDLVMMVRFSSQLLSQWPQLDAITTSFASSVIK